MLSIFITLAFVGSRPDPYAVAFSARYYYAPTVKRTSHSQLYTCALDGSQRHCWTHVTGEVREVWWKSKNVLGFQVVNSSEGPGADISFEWQLNLLTKKQVRIGKVRNPDSWHARYKFPMGGSMSMSETKIALQKKGHSLEQGPQPDPGATKFSIDGKQVDSFEGSPTGFYFDEKSNNFWIFTYDHDSTTGSHYAAYLMNWKTNQAEEKLRDARMADFHTDRSTFAMVSHRDTMPYGKNRTVWMSQAIVGDWKTGERHLIAGPTSLDDSSQPNSYKFKTNHSDLSYQFAIVLRP